MKYILAILIFITSLSPSVADEEYTNMIYTSVTLLYWCIYKDTPKNRTDISKVTDLDEPNKNITIGFNEWLSTLSYKIENEVMIITRKNTISKSNCASVQIIEK